MTSAERTSIDVIVVGSGPAGVSAAFPLVDAGLRVLLVDGGEMPSDDVPDAEYLSVRTQDPHQWEWMLGRDFHALRGPTSLSPKFRVATLEYVFRGFAERNRIAAQGFAPFGSLAVGGLSNAWGAGVACFGEADLTDFPFDASALRPSYEAVARRIGISGRSDDDLVDFFGVDAWAQAPIPMDSLHERLLDRYRRSRDGLMGEGFKLGRARVAALSEAGPQGRRTCTRQGFCLWGCGRKALYSARYDLQQLLTRPNFRHRPGLVVEKLMRDGESWRVCGRDAASHAGESIPAPRVVMAAGALASTAILMRSLPGFAQARLLDVPTAAFVLWLPAFLGAARAPAPGLAQLAFTLDGAKSGAICGFTFSTHALPVTEFVRHTPLARRNGLRVFRAMASSTIVANCFFHSDLSDNRLSLDADGTMRVTRGAKEGWQQELDWTRRRLRSAFGRIGAVLLPASFRPGEAASAAHYAGSVPMRERPVIGEATPEGEVQGLPGVYAADAAAFSSLPAKSHTLALMACADRVGRTLVRKFAARA